MNKQERDSIVQREESLQKWLGKRNSYKPEELPANIIPPTNEERSAVEVYDFLNNPPDKYSLYISEKEKNATTWTGEVLGSVGFGKAFRSGFGDVRVPIVVYGINKRKYYGTYYKSAGDYARVRLAKH